MVRSAATDLVVRLAVLRRYIFVKLKPKYCFGVKRVQLLKSAKEVLHAAYGVQALYVGTAADATTEAHWDICITLEFASDVDLERSLKDSVTRAFLSSYLQPRADAVWTATFEGESAGPRRL